MDAQEDVYYLRAQEGQTINFFINNRRVDPNATYEIQLDDEIMIESPANPERRWYVNNQYVGTGSLIRFKCADFLYSAEQNMFVLSYED